MNEAKLKYDIGELKASASPMPENETTAETEKSEDLLPPSRQAKLSLMKVVLMGTIITALVIYAAMHMPIKQMTAETT